MHIVLYVYNIILLMRLTVPKMKKYSVGLVAHLKSLNVCNIEDVKYF